MKGKVGEVVEVAPAGDKDGVSEEGIAEEDKEEDEVSEEDKAEDADEEARWPFTTCTSWLLSLGYNSDDGSRPSKSIASWVR